MAAIPQIWCLLLMCLASVAVGGRILTQEVGNSCDSLNAKTVTYRSPPLTAKPGEVNNKFFLPEVPNGHIGIKCVNAELVYENGMPVPLTDVYVHHWVLYQALVPKRNSQTHLQDLLRQMRKHHNHVLPYGSTSFGPLAHNMKLHSADTELPRIVNVWGFGGETRRTETRLPGRYVFDIAQEVEGYETAWILNVHGLDTRGAVNRMGCVECRCNLYNSTTDDDGNPLPEGYLGGLRCCGDGRQCAVEEGFNGEERTYHLEYTWEYVDWNECLTPVSLLGMDVTNHDGFSEDLLEFTVEGCGSADPSSEACIDTRVATIISPVGGEIVITVSHIHAMTLNATLWGEDGRLICETSPIYGQGHEAGDEKGYVVGIKSCYGNPGSPDAAKIKQGEKLTYVVQSTKVGGPHTGLMGLVGLKLVSDGESAAY